MFSRLFMPPQAAVAEPPSAPTPVAEQHKAYVDPLVGKISKGRRVLAAKEEYVRAARDLGLQLASVEHVAEQVRTRGGSLLEADKALERVRRALAAGYEPTTPPDWFCGVVREPAKETRWDRFGGKFQGYPDETWPRKGMKSDDDNPYVTFIREREGHVVWVYRGPMPVSAMRAVVRAEPFFDSMRVYSPVEEHFQKLSNPRPRPRDPVLIGRIDVLDEPQYFEVARWDIDADLAHILS